MEGRSEQTQISSRKKWTTFPELIPITKDTRGYYTKALKLTDPALAFDIPSQVPATAKKIQVQIFIRSGGEKNDEFDYTMSTVDSDGDYYYHHSKGWSYDQIAVSFSSETVSFPIDGKLPSRRYLYLKSNRDEEKKIIMAGMKFEYDENGGKFYYFLLSVYGLILIPATYWLWPKAEKRKSVPHPEDTSNFSPCRDKHQLLHANEPSRRRRAIITKIGLILAWIILVILAYRVSLIEIEHKEYDPFAVLDIDREASISEIKRAYRELSKKHHPDRGGDPEQFKEIAKAYKTLTDEEAKENWKKYGNPDGPGVTHFGIALPKWLVDHQNSVFVLLVYAGIFMIVLPVIVCIWWQKSARYSGDQILTDTVQLYWYFLSRTSSIIVKRAIMILSASKEFDRTRNPLIVDRLSDNVELPKLFRDLPDVQEKTKERPFQFPYC